jgi:hypothetical protein
MLGIRIPYLVCVPRVPGLLGFFVDEQGSHTPLEVVACLPCYLASPSGSMT